MLHLKWVKKPFPLRIHVCLKRDGQIPHVINPGDTEPGVARAVILCILYSGQNGLVDVRTQTYQWVRHTIKDVSEKPDMAKRE